MPPSGFEPSKTGIRSFSLALEKTIEEAINAAEDALAAGVNEWKNEAVLVIPVEFGRARQSLRSDTSREGHILVGTVGSNVHYVLYIEMGTAFIAGGAVRDWKPGDPPITDWPAKRADNAQREQMPFLRPTGFDIAPKILDDINKALKDTVRRRLHGKKFK